MRVPKTTEAPGFQLPEWVVTALKVVGYPALAFALIAGAIALAHALRRRRRRSTGDASRRFAHGWTDVVDRARDLGMTIPAGLTRIEQARVVGYAPLAKEADQATFGPGEPDAAQTQEFWTRVGAARKELTKQASMVKRFGRLFSLRSLLFRDPRPVEQLPARQRSARDAGSSYRAWQGPVHEAQGEPAAGRRRPEGPPRHRGRGDDRRDLGRYLKLADPAFRVIPGAPDGSSRSG